MIMNFMELMISVSFDYSAKCILDLRNGEIIKIKEFLKIIRTYQLLLHPVYRKHLICILFNSAWMQFYRFHTWKYEALQHVSFYFPCLYIVCFTVQHLAMCSIKTKSFFLTGVDAMRQKRNTYSWTLLRPIYEVNQAGLCQE